MVSSIVCRRDFRKNEEGTIAIIFGLIAIMMVGFAGVAVDMTRAYTAGSRADSALDAAVLAAGRAKDAQNLQGNQLRQYAENYFQANIGGNQGDPTRFTNFSLTQSNDGNTFTATVDVVVPTYFAGLLNHPTFDFTRSTTATFDTLDLELGLMLDVTGSMNNPPSTGGGQTKLEILKRAVELDLVEILVPDNNDEKIRIGYAPYSASVNVGPLSGIVSDPAQPSTDGCVVERTAEVDSEIPPSAGIYFRGIEQANTTLTQDQNANDVYDYYRCPLAQVLPLTSSKSDLTQTINSYSASGRTAGHLGIAWAWYLVSPEWGGIWGGNSVPKAYGTPDLIKAVVLLTDGKFNASYGGSDFFNPAVDESYTRAGSLCNNIKGQEVIVFSIGFDLDDSQASDALENCASINPKTGQKYYYPTADETELRQAFREIAERLKNLRLSK